jgi:hypothetical protein
MTVFERPEDDGYSELPAPVGTVAKFGHFPALEAAAVNARAA